ncbi:hypothetical protein D3C77_670920 [compost metagenome]
MLLYAVDYERNSDVSRMALSVRRRSQRPAELFCNKAGYYRRAVSVSAKYSFHRAGYYHRVTVDVYGRGFPGLSGRPAKRT